jgi:hypothetical protein
MAPRRQHAARVAGLIALLGVNRRGLTQTNDQAYDLIIAISAAELDDVPAIAAGSETPPKITETTVSLPRTFRPEAKIKTTESHPLHRQAFYRTCIRSKQARPSLQTV